MTTSDWGGLGGIVAEARALDQDEKARPLIDCPTCGEPLQFNAAGEGNCVYGHYRSRPGETRDGR